MKIFATYCSLIAYSFLTNFPSIILDDHGIDDSMTVLEELEKIDDDCDKHGIQFVKIDDDRTSRSYGIESVPAIVFFEKQEPNIYDGDLLNEEEILQWLLSQLEKDEIEDVTEEMLDKMIKDGDTLAVLFCTYPCIYYIEIDLKNFRIDFECFFQMIIMMMNHKKYLRNWRISTMNVMHWALHLLKSITLMKLKNMALTVYHRCCTLKRVFQPFTRAV